MEIFALIKYTENNYCEPTESEMLGVFAKGNEDLAIAYASENCGCQLTKFNVGSSVYYAVTRNSLATYVFEKMNVIGQL